MKKFMIEGSTTIGPSLSKELNVLMDAVAHAIDTIECLDSWRFVMEDIRDGESEPRILVSLVSVNGHGENYAFEKIRTLKNHPKIFNTGEMKRQLRYLAPDEVHRYGGIRVPYHGIDGEGEDSIMPVSGSIYAAFSGANEAVDLGVVLHVMSEYMQTCDTNEADTRCIFYDTEGVMRDQLVSYMASMIQFWI